VQDYGRNCNILKYNSLISCIPNKWKKVLRANDISNLVIDENILVNINDQEIELRLLNSKIIYNFFISNKNVQSTTNIKYEEEYDLQKK
jgi:hypothetical protein